MTLPPLPTPSSDTSISNTVSPTPSDTTTLGSSARASSPPSSLIPHPSSLPIDWDLIGRLPDAVRFEFNVLYESLSILTSCAACKPIAAKLGLSWQRVYDRVKNYRQTGDILCLINLSKAGPKFQNLLDPAGLPRDFLEKLWWPLVIRNQRKVKPAHTDLVHIYHFHLDPITHAAYPSIPGYTQWPAPDPFTKLPPGWSYSNLIRQENLPSKFSIDVARHGRAHAAAYRPTLLQTRVGLDIMQFITIDDLEHDLFVNFVDARSKRDPQRPLELACLDIFSGCKIAYGLKPCLINDETGSKEKLKEREALFLLAHIFINIGFNPKKGTTILAERGTAAVPKAAQETLLRLSDGLIKVETGGLRGAPAFAGDFAKPAGGNSRFKAQLESHHNLTHNQLASLPGQTGKDRNDRPEALNGRLQYNEWLTQVSAVLPPDRAQLLQYPFLEWTQFTQLLAEIYHRINHRTDHKLEGWLQAGLVTQEWATPKEPDHWLPWTQFLQLPTEDQSVLSVLFRSHPSLVRVRQLSPHEVFYGHNSHTSHNSHNSHSNLLKLPAWTILALLPEDFRQPFTIHDGVIAFESQDLGPGDFHYDVHEALQTRGRHFADGEQIMCIVNPIDPSKLYMADDKGRFLGVALRTQRVRKDDLEGIQHAMGRVAHAETERLQNLRKAAAAESRATLAMHNNNLSILPDNKISDSAKREVIATTLNREPKPAQPIDENAWV